MSEPLSSVPGDEAKAFGGNGVKEELPGRRVASRVLTAEAEVQVAERNPARLAAPPYMDQTLSVWQHAREI
jgi:hypothetical protein